MMYQVELAGIGCENYVSEKEPISERSRAHLRSEIRIGTAEGQVEAEKREKEKEREKSSKKMAELDEKLRMLQGALHLPEGS